MRDQLAHQYKHAPGGEAPSQIIKEQANAALDAFKAAAPNEALAPLNWWIAASTSGHGGGVLSRKRASSLSSLSAESVK